MIKWLLAWRYFFKRPISILAVAAVTLCVFIVLVVMTVMNGLVEDFRQKNHDYAGDCVIASDSLVGFGYYEDFLELLKSQSFIEAVSPVAKGVGLLSQPGATRNVSIEVHGVDPVLHSQATGFGQTLYYRKDNPELAFAPKYAPQANGCVLGIELLPIYRDEQGIYRHPAEPGAYHLTLSVFPLNIKGLLLRSDYVSTKSFYYSDDSHSGLVRVDGGVVYVPLEQAQLICGMDSPIRRVTSIHIKFNETVSERFGVEQVRRLWNDYAAQNADKPGGNLFDNVRVQSWQENRRHIIAPMEKEQTMLLMLFLMLGVITVFIIFVVLYMIIGHKSKDIGILISMGVRLSDILWIFLLFSVFIALIGSLIGGASGWIFLYNVNDLEHWLLEKYGWQLWNRQVYAIGEIPNEVNPHVLAAIVSSAVLACMVGALIPGIQAARKNPARILQVNQL